MGYREEMDRNRQLSRVLRVLFDFMKSDESFSVKELAIRYRVHPKTIRRDLKAIGESPFGLISTNGDGERSIRMKRKFRLTNES